jgi:hypothetical protein
MTHFKLAYFIILVAVLNYSCNNVSEKNDVEQHQKSKIFNCLIDSIGKNDTLCINYLTDGCFHHSTEKLRIYKKADSLFAELSVSISPEEQKYLPLIQYLKDSSVIAYSEFEKKGRTLKASNARCTTSKEYMIFIKADSIKFEDDGCEFEGYSILKNKIFGEKELENYYKKNYR